MIADEEMGTRPLWGKEGVAKTVAGSLEPPTPKSPQVSPLEKAWDIDPAIRREMLAGEIYRDILNAYWPNLADVGIGSLDEPSFSELCSACASSAVLAADALQEALKAAPIR